MNRIFPFLSGVLFSAGLLIAGMTQPAKIVGFLDFFGAWDPSMMMVTLGAVTVYMPVHRWVMRLQRPLFASGFSLPEQKHVEPRLLLGSALFGVGWGLAGYCPGPVVASLGTASTTVIVFAVAMLAGMAGFAALERAKTAPNP